MELLNALDTTAIVMLFFAAALLGLLIGAGSGWRELQRRMRNAPVQRALRRSGGTLSARDARTAQVRCALCPVKATCLAVLEREHQVPAECPNRTLFA